MSGRVAMSGIVLGLAAAFGLLPQAPAAPAAGAAGAEEYRVHARHIQFAPSEEAKAREVLADLKAGKATWDAAVLEHSIDFYTKRAGGDLGWVQRGSKHPEELKAAALQLNEKEYSPDLVKTALGWHILQAVGKEKVTAPPPPPPPPPPGGEKVPTTPAPPKAKVEATLAVDRADPIAIERLELEVRVANTGTETVSVPRPELWPFGVRLTRDVATEKNPEIKAAYRQGLGSAPAALVALLPGQAMLQKFKVGEVWDTATAEGYWEATFSGGAVLAALDAEGMPAALKDLKKAEGFAKVDELWRPLGAKEPVGFDYHTFTPDKAFYVVMSLKDGSEFLVKLSSEPQSRMQARYFVDFVRQGFYKDKWFYKREAGQFISGGAPQRDGSGWPERTGFVSANALETVTIKEKDLVMIVRPKQYTYESGSAFMIALKDLPAAQYKNTGIVIGTVIGGWETIEKLGSDTGWNNLRGKEIRSARLKVEADLEPRWRASVAGAGKPAEPKGPLPKVVIETSKGAIEMELYEDDAPNSVANFIELSEKGFYNGLTFHRVEPGFVIQGGDPTGTGQGGPGYTIKDEVNPRKHVLGAVGMAKTRAPNSAGSQFYICTGDAPHLDRAGTYTVFGKVTSGMDVATKIAKGDTITKVTVKEKRPHEYTAEKIGAKEPATPPATPKGAPKEAPKEPAPAK